MGSAVSSAARDSLAAAERLRPPRVPRHRRWWLLLVAVLLVAAGGLANYVLVSAADERVEVLVAARDIGWGSTITRADLGRELLAVEGAGHVIPVAELDRVVGRMAAASVPGGGLLAPGHVRAQGVPGPGEVLVGLRAATMPARGVWPGELVRVVPLVSDPVTGGERADLSGGFDARVVDTSRPDAQGVRVVDVVVADDWADRATAAAAGRVLLVLPGADG